MNKELILFIKALGDTNRLRILYYLKKECCVSDLWEKMGLSQNLASHHLKVLKGAKLVIAEKRGLKVIYMLDKKQLSSSLELLQNYLK